MKLLIVASLIIMSLTGCARKVEEDLKKNEESAKELIQRLAYVKDERTGLCFAYAWSGGGYGGPALTEVSCEKVEKYLEQSPNKVQK